MNHFPSVRLFISFLSGSTFVKHTHKQESWACVLQPCCQINLCCHWLCANSKYGTYWRYKLNCFYSTSDIITYVWIREACVVHFQRLKCLFPHLVANKYPSLYCIDDSITQLLNHNSNFNPCLNYAPNTELLHTPLFQHNQLEVTQCVLLWSRETLVCTIVKQPFELSSHAIYLTKAKRFYKTRDKQVLQN